MRQETIQLYQFKELSQKAKEKVLEKFRYINVDDDWCDFLYEDFKEELKRIGVECNTFYWSDDRDYHIYMDEARIINKEKFFKGILGNNYKKYKILKNLDNKDIEEELKKLNLTDWDFSDYLNNILEGFLKRLRNDHEYLISDEAIEETLEANEYDFLEKGERF